MAEAGGTELYRYVLSRDITLPVKVRICHMDGEREKQSYIEIMDDLFLPYSGLYASQASEIFVQVQLWAGGQPLCLPEQTCYHPFSSHCKWNEWLTLPVRYCDLPVDSCLVFTIYDCYAPGESMVVGGSSFPMFSPFTRKLRKGAQKLVLFPAMEGDVNQTPGLKTELDETDRLEKLCKHYQRNILPHIEWLDRLAFMEIEKIKNAVTQHYKHNLYLYIELPIFEYPVIFRERTGPVFSAAARVGDTYTPSTTTAQSRFQQVGGRANQSTSQLMMSDHDDDLQLSASVGAAIAGSRTGGMPMTSMGPASSTLGFPAGRRFGSNINKSNQIVWVQDNEMNRDNPVDLKHLKLARSGLRVRGVLDMDLKPNQEERKQLKRIVQYPVTRHLYPEEKELLWRFRYFLKKDAASLSKFLMAVDWRDPLEAKEALLHMKEWETLEPAAALELLSKSFKRKEVRRYAVDRLSMADDNELMSYLLQLVQALRYEHSTETPLADLLLKRACTNRELGSYLYWYLLVESNAGTSSATALNPNNAPPSAWRIKDSKFYAKKLEIFRLKLARSEDPETRAAVEQLRRGEELIRELVNLQLALKNLPYSRPKKINTLRAWLSPKGKYQHLANMSENSLMFPLDPSIYVTGIIPEKASMYKSAMAPLGLTFKVANNPNKEEYVAIFKSGDDMRQDQLVLQLISLMDSLLKRESLDLCLTPYKVLACSGSDGFVEYIPSHSVASILRHYDGDLRKFLREYNPGGGDYGIEPQILDNFVRSCAGYCVITFILGIGDRHLDNLLMNTQGRLFHIDFGFMLGRDPKPFAPPMKLCKEMVECMGGANSKHYQKFKEHCCEAYNILRKSANIILNLFSLMLDADIPDIAAEREKSLLKVLEKFHLDLDDEEANHLFQNLINDSVSALFPQLTETIHRWAQYWRS